MERDYTSPTRGVVVAIVFVVLLIVITCIFLFKTNNKDVVLKQPSPVTVVIKDLTLDEQLFALRDRSRIDIPPILSEKESSSNNLSTAILTLMGSEAIYNKVKSVTYDTKYSGYEIELSYPKPVRDAYFSVLKSTKTEKWTNIYGSRYENSGILDIENSTYKARVEFSEMNDSNTNVSMFVINKKI